MTSHSPARTVAVFGIALAAILVSGGVAALPAQADANNLKPGTPHSLTAAVEVPTDQFIVGIKDKAGTASVAAGEAATEAASKVGARATGLRQTATGAHVVKTDRALPAAEAEGFLRALRTDPDVEYAEPDAIMQTAAVAPSDSYYPLQWNLWEEPGSMRVPGAWDVNRGAGVVVAVVDTGITGHSDLDANVLPGYDMISSAAMARDGNGRDADPTDEGDWVSAGQCSSSNGDGISSWHGTHVAGTIAAIGNNNNGVTGVAPEAKILPLRAVGACGGYTSDIADSIIWAAGGAVAGTTSNANPARVINLSLGGINTCSATYQNAINFAYNAGAAVVVAAGNSNRPAADASPANCENVITVGASARSGARAPYSNYGSVVDVTAPGGDMSADLYDGILSTSNFGMTTSEGEAYEFLQGTSMAAPHVAGVAALLMSKMGGTMTPAEVEARLKETARPLSAVCSLGCGAGLVNASAALFTEGPGTKVTPAAVVFVDGDGTASDTYTIPTSEGIEYVVGGLVVAAGQYAGSGTVMVKAREKADYVFTAGVTVEWSHTFSSAVAPVPGSLRPVAPFRALDTRNGSPVAPDSSTSFQVAGVNGIPQNVAAVVFNLTVAEAKNFGFVTAYASGTARPYASNVNFGEGQIVPNAVTVPVGADGRVALYNRSAGTTHLLADVSGYYLPGQPTAAGAFQAIAPKRFLDTRDTTAVRPDSAITFQVAGVHGVPANVSAVVFNLTVAHAENFGYATAYPSGTSRPNASNVNFLGGQIVPNSVTVPVGADGKVALFNRSAGSTHLVADVAGYFIAGTPTASGTFQAVAPSRFLDTRDSVSVSPDSSVSFQVGGRNGIPADASAVVFNMTVAQAQSFGYATAYASGTARPNASNVNFLGGQIVPNSVTVPIGLDGRVALFNRSDGATHLIADVSGYYLR